MAMPSPDLRGRSERWAWGQGRALPGALRAELLLCRKSVFCPCCFRSKLALQGPRLLRMERVGGFRSRAANDFILTFIAGGRSWWKTLAPGLGKRQVICHGRVPTCMCPAACPWEVLPAWHVE